MANDNETRYELSHPSGRFTVNVTAERRDVLVRRGYRPTGESETPTPKPGTPAAARRGRPPKK